MKLMEFIVKDAIIPDLKSTEKKDVINEMVDALKETNSIDKDEVKDILRALNKREELGSTGIGKGVAVPHTKHPSIKSIVGLMARSVNGVEFDALDGEPVYLFFLLLSPSDSSSSHLSALERISNVIRDGDFRRFIKEASSKKEIIETIEEVDEKSP
ncbi:MAG: PTS sugar transporter subunit IIA [Candidatus Anammoxibacter sp.]